LNEFSGKLKAHGREKMEETNKFMEFVNMVLANKEAILLVLTSTVTAAAAIAALTPTPKDDSVIGYLRKVVDYLAFNFGNAKNKTE